MMLAMILVAVVILVDLDMLSFSPKSTTPRVLDLTSMVGKRKT
jgi:hypothetical protein